MPVPSASGRRVAFPAQQSTDKSYVAEDKRDEDHREDRCRAHAYKLPRVAVREWRLLCRPGVAQIC